MGIVNVATVDTATILPVMVGRGVMGTVPISRDLDAPAVAFIIVSFVVVLFIAFAAFIGVTLSTGGDGTTSATVDHTPRVNVGTTSAHTALLGIADRAILGMAEGSALVTAAAGDDAAWDMAMASHPIQGTAFVARPRSTRLGRRFSSQAPISGNETLQLKVSLHRWLEYCKNSTRRQNRSRFVRSSCHRRLGYNVL